MLGWYKKPLEFAFRGDEDRGKKANSPLRALALLLLLLLCTQVQPKLPDNFEDNTWEKLKKAVKAIQTKQPIATSREELYRAVEDLCVHKMGAKLYDRYCKQVHNQSAIGMRAGRGVPRNTTTPPNNAGLPISCGDKLTRVALNPAKLRFGRFWLIR